MRTLALTQLPFHQTRFSLREAKISPNTLPSGGPGRFSSVDRGANEAVGRRSGAPGASDSAGEEKAALLSAEHP